MKFLVASTFLACLAVATPTPPSASPQLSDIPELVPLSLIKRQSTSITLCRDANLQNCQGFGLSTGVCNNVPGEWNDVVSSLATAANSATCTFYTDGGCGGTSWTVGGAWNTIPSNMNDRISSVRC